MNVYDLFFNRSFSFKLSLCVGLSISKPHNLLKDLFLMKKEETSLLYSS